MANTILKPPVWVEVAAKELGVQEIPGLKSNPRIIEYNKSTTLKATTDEIPWCSSFVGWCLQSAGEHPTGSAAARSYCNWGNELKEPKFGCITVLKRGNSEWQGHVGFYVGGDSFHVKLLAGNQHDKVCILNFPKTDVLSYRWPK